MLNLFFFTVYKNGVKKENLQKSLIRKCPKMLYTSQLFFPFFSFYRVFQVSLIYFINIIVKYIHYFILYAILLIDFLLSKPEINLRTETSLSVL